VATESSLAIFYGKAGVTVAAPGRGETDMRFYDQSGNQSIVAGVKADGLSGITVVDRYGKVKSAIGIAADGKPILLPVR
jgi:hypothetical protein